MANYNPIDYVPDYSWLGDIGNKMSELGKRIPSLLKLSREIEQNNKFKEEHRQAMYEYVALMPDDMVVKLNQQLKLTEDNAPIEEKKSKLQKMIPEFTESTTNQEYAKKLATDTWNVWYAAGKRHPLGPIKYEDFMTVPMRSGGIANEIEEIPDIAADKAFKRETQEAVGRQSALAPGQNQQVMDQQKTLDAYKQEQGQKSARLIQGAVTKFSTSPEQAAQFVADNGGTKEDAQAAFDQADNNRRQEEQKRQNNRMYAEKRLDKKETMKQFELMSPTEIQTMFANVARTIGTIRDDRRQLEVSNKAGDIDGKKYEEMKDELVRAEKNAVENQKLMYIANEEFVKARGKTKDDYRDAEASARSIIEQRNEQARNDLIDKYESNGYGDLWVPKGVEKKRFVEDYKTQFEEEPRFSNVDSGNKKIHKGQRVVRPAQSASTTSPSSSGDKKKVKTHVEYRAEAMTELNNLKNNPEYKDLFPGGKITTAQLDILIAEKKRLDGVQ